MKKENNITSDKQIEFISLYLESLAIQSEIKEFNNRIKKLIK